MLERLRVLVGKQVSVSFDMEPLTYFGPYTFVAVHASSAQGALLELHGTHTYLIPLVNVGMIREEE
jgi:hypothetical protein